MTDALFLTLTHLTEKNYLLLCASVRSYAIEHNPSSYLDGSANTPNPRNQEELNKNKKNLAYALLILKSTITPEIITDIGSQILDYTQTLQDMMRSINNHFKTGEYRDNHEILELKVQSIKIQER